MREIRRIALVALGLALLGVQVAEAGPDDAPTPRRSPRVPVKREMLIKPALPPSRSVDGSATIIDTERLKIGDVEMRLFGIVPPQLAASWGPQARAVLDSLAGVGAVGCVIRDRDRDGRFLATCRSANNADLAQELLRRGLAVTARGSLGSTELAGPYLTTEKLAQDQRLGLWSVMPPPPVSSANMIQAEAKSAAEAALTAATPIPVPQPKPEILSRPADIPSGKAGMMPPPALPLPEVVTPVAAAPVAAPGFFERYQLLLASLFLALAAAGFLSTSLILRWLDRRAEARSVAAALRGELMAARTVCLGRLRESGDVNAMSWPRLRTLVFQAYVGRLGMLGSDLARKVASIYGQASDYAAYYNTPGSEVKPGAISKRQALQTLLQHIEQVLPRLAAMELPQRPAQRTARAIARTRDVSGAGAMAAHEAYAHESYVPEAGAPKNLTAANMPTDFKSQETPPPSVAPSPENAPDVKAPEEGASVASATVTSKPDLVPEVAKITATVESAAAAVTGVVTPVKEPEPSSLSAVQPPAAVNGNDGPFWNVLRKFTAVRLARHQTAMNEDIYPDYANMSEEEIEALAYGEAMDELKQQRRKEK